MARLSEEHTLEDEIVQALERRGWVSDAHPGPRYDRTRALYTPDLLVWMRETETDAWITLLKRHGEAGAEAKLLDRVRRSLGEAGTLDVLRNGIDMVGLRRTLRLAQFRPASGLNPDIVRRYGQNRLRVVQQVRYSVESENSIDLVLFLNGIPTATIELKTDFTQSVADAIDQYRRDRLPQPKGGRAEPLLAFASGALVHFALSSSRVMMTTRLAGAKTMFLPFNRGNNGAAGNAPQPFGAATAYFWEEVLARDSWLDILGRYIVTKHDKKGAASAIFFPRYHQLDATRKLLEAVKTEGAGGAHLIQHSAGSGKTASIAWTAHFLSELHDENDAKVFSTIIVISDRRVIDGQLQEALSDFQRTTGVVETITNTGGAKSGQLADALAAGKKIIVCTIQTFPFALEAVREAAAAEGKTFAVIADEAHSSQTGEASGKLREMLSAEAAAQLADGGGVDAEDLLAAQMAARADNTGITFVAFTATPKAKTLELFGRLENPSAPASEVNRRQPFHVYSMRQAIEEGFILDVLDNYTPYATAFRLAQQGRELDEKEVERSAATKSIMRWVRLHPHNIAQKVQITVEHFLANVAPLLDGQAKAMVVLASRQEAVRWKLAVDRYIAAEGLQGLRAIVAFSGEVEDAESFPDPVRETSASLNPGLNGRDLRDAFRDDDARLLLVANKFQTGFDEPLLCGMYVDRRLAGVQAVQTLSRLNRSHSGKDTTFVLDFVNSADEVLSAFKTYYEVASLADTTDPEQVLTIKAKLDAGDWYDTHEVERVAAVRMDPAGTQARLSAALQPVAQRLLTRFAVANETFKSATEADEEQRAAAAKDERDALILMKKDMETYSRLYTYLSQMIDFANTGIEKRHWFYGYLVRLLDFSRERSTVDMSMVELTHHSVRALDRAAMTLGEGGSEPLQPLSAAGSGAIMDKEKALLAEIIAKVNTLFEGNLTDGDQLSYLNAVAGKMMESEKLNQQARANTKAQFDASPAIDTELFEAAIEAMAAHERMGTQAVNSPELRKGLRAILLNEFRLYDRLREGAPA